MTAKMSQALVMMCSRVIQRAITNDGIGLFRCAAFEMALQQETSSGILSGETTKAARSPASDGVSMCEDASCFLAADYRRWHRALQPAD
jgi:hypothetical protein